MIPFPIAIWLAIEPVDMRWGIDRLSGYIQQAVDKHPCDGSAYALSNRQRTRLKLVQWDGTGVWLCQRRLHRGHFTWPQAGDRVCAMTISQWRWLITGVDWQRLVAQPHAHWQV